MSKKKIFLKYLKRHLTWLDEKSGNGIIVAEVTIGFYG